MNKLHTAIYVITIISTAALVIIFFVLISFISKGIVEWGTFFTIMISGIIELILLYGLNSALSSIEKLEKEIKSIKNSLSKNEPKDSIPDDSEVTITIDDYMRHIDDYTHHNQ